MLPLLLPLPAQGQSLTLLPWLLPAPPDSGMKDKGKASSSHCWYKKGKEDFSPQLLTCDPLHTTPAHQRGFQGASLVQ